MTPAQFRSLLDELDELREQLYRAYRSKRRIKVQDTLARVRDLYAPEDVMPYVQIQVGVLHREAQKSTKLSWLQVSYHDDGELFTIGGDADPRGYEVEGKLITVSDDQCPKCFGEWCINLHNRQPCPGCGVELGKQVMIVAEQDICPFCQEERADDSSHLCECGFDWQADYVAKVV